MNEKNINRTNRNVKTKKTTTRQTVPRDSLKEIVRRIAQVAKPDKIILFGSAARGRMGPNSDIDLMVIKSGKFHRGRLTEKIYMNLFGVCQAVDVVVVTSKDVSKYRDSLGLVIRPAMKEGKVVYAS